MTYREKLNKFEELGIALTALKSEILATVFSISIIQMKNLKNCAISQKRCT